MTATTRLLAALASPRTIIGTGGGILPDFVLVNRADLAELLDQLDVRTEANRCTAEGGSRRLTVRCTHPTGHAGAHRADIGGGTYSWHGAAS